MNALKLFYENKDNITCYCICIKSKIFFHYLFNLILYRKKSIKKRYVRDRKEKHVELFIYTTKISIVKSPFIDKAQVRASVCVWRN